MKRTIGICLLACGVFVGLFGTTLSIFPAQEAFYGIDDSWPVTVRLAFLFLAGISIFLGNLLVRGGLRWLQPTAEQLLASDSRPPVIFLRSFKDDSLAVPAKRYKTSPLDWVPARTVESGLTPTLSRLGPVLAIGKPGELLPQLGAARVYVHDSEWQAKIAEWMQKSCLTLLMVHQTTPGTDWELNHAIAHLPPQRFALYFPSLTKDEPGREAQYTAYSESQGSVFPKGLPGSLDSAQFILFEPDWTPQKVETALDVVNKVSDASTSKISAWKILRPGTLTLLVFLGIGMALEIGYAIYRLFR